MGAAEGAFDFDLEFKKRSSLATILDKVATLLIGSPHDAKYAINAINAIYVQYFPELTLVTALVTTVGAVTLMTTAVELYL